MRSVMKKLIVIVIFFIIIYPGYSQLRGSRKVYTLDKCIEIAKKKNFDIIENQARIEAAGAQLTNAFGNFLPSVNFNMGYQRHLNAEGAITADIGGAIIPIPPQPPNSYNMSATAQLLLFDGFYREAYYNLSKNNYDAATLGTQHSFGKVVKDVFSQYIEVIRNAQIVKIRRENMLLSQKEYERGQALYESGVTSISDVYALEAELANKEYDLVISENSLNISKIRLLTTIGEEPDIEAEFLESSISNIVKESDITKFRTEIGTMSASLGLALNNRLDYQSLTKSLESSESGITMASRGYYPTLSGMGGWSWSNSVFEDFNNRGRYYIGLNLSIPVFENFRTNYQIQNAKLQYQQSEIMLMQTEYNIRAEVQSAFLNLESAEKQLDITSKAMKSSSKNYEIVRERYSVGTANITELIQADTRYIASQINRVNAVYNYYNVQKELIYSIGKLY